jgi:Photosynthesis system II assembly factor YCF48
MAKIPKIVGQRLQASAQLGEHPDPNLLTGFAERSLGKGEQREVLQHLSQCASCREMVWLSASQPDIAGVVSTAAAGRRWLSLPVLRWGAVLTCVLVVGAAVTLHERSESRRPAGATADLRPAGAPQFPAPNQAVENKAASLQGNLASTPLAKSPAVAQKLSVPKPASRNHAPASSPPVEMAEARAASSIADIVPGRAKDALAESHNAQTANAMGAPLAMKKNIFPPLPSEAFLPENLIPRWTLSSDGTLQRSLDSGRTWQTISVSSHTGFRALSATGLDIWVGGAAGALFHSSDAGQHWTQIRPIVNGEVLKDDIIGVEFRDALQGRLTTSIQETWITADAGQTWQKR